MMMLRRLTRGKVVVRARRRWHMTLYNAARAGAAIRS
jgi:hypothetical protein